MDKKKTFKPVATQKYEYRIIDYQRPYKDYGAKEQDIMALAIQGWELISTSVIPMGISDDNRKEATWKCTACGFLINFKGENQPKKCNKCGVVFENEGDLELVEQRLIKGKKMWCIEHLYFRREVQEKE